MPIKLTLEEKLYLVAVLGDIPDFQRARLWPMSALPVQAGPQVMAEGKRFVSYIGQIAARKPVSQRLGRPKRTRL